jgi:hypothetical protein
MIDPRIALVLLAIYGAIWGVGKVVHKVEVLKHKVDTAVVKVVKAVAHHL